MKRLAIKMLVAVALVMGGGMLATNNVSAWTTGASVNWNSGIDPDGGTTFGVSLYFSSDCGWCEQVGDFRCSYRGAAYTTSICSTSEWYTWSSADWDNYGVRLYPCWSGQQTIDGSFRRRRQFTLSAVAIDLKGKAIGSNPSPSTVYYDDTAKVTHKDIKNYTFLGWRKNKAATTKKSQLGLGTKDSYSKKLRDNVTVYAVYAAKRTLEIVPISMTKAKITECKTASKTVAFGEKLTMTVPSCEGWTFQGCRDDRAATTKLSELKACDANKVTKTMNNYTSSKTTIYAVYQKDGFEGLSRVAVTGSKNADWSSLSSDTKTETGWTASNSTKTIKITSCPEDGCSVTFWHYLRQSKGDGDSKYSIKRTSNMSGYVSPLALKAGTAKFKSSDEQKVFGGDNGTGDAAGKVAYKLKKKGDRVCESMEFEIKLNTKRTLKVCAEYQPDAKPEGDPKDPDDPDSEPELEGHGSGIDIQVRNTNVDAYSSWSRSVYAKPTDILAFQATYTPTVQDNSGDVPQKVRVDGGGVCPSKYDEENTSPLSSAMASCSGKTWANGFSIYSTGFRVGSHFENSSRSIGDASTQRPAANYHVVNTTEAGVTLSETATTNYSIRYAPNSVSYGTVTQVGKKKVMVTVKTTDEEGNEVEKEEEQEQDDPRTYQVADVSTATISSTANALVPYNFVNTTRMTTCNSEDMDRYDMECSDEYTTGSATFYAGETATLKFDVITDPRQNNVTDGYYATVVPEAMARLGICVGNDCDAGNYNYHTSQPSRTYNASYNMNGSTYTGDSMFMHIPDVAAGTRICARSEIYPKDSGSDTNLSTRYYNVNDINSWAVSEPVCFTVAKRPNMQVWGGNVYSNGSMSTALSEKGPLAAGFSNAYSPSGTYNKRIFGSWGELGVISNGAVIGFASGASLGYGGVNSDGTLIPNPLNNIDNNNPQARFSGGSNQTTFCKNSPLTMANRPCGAALGVIGNASGNNGPVKDKSALIRKYVYGGSANASGDIRLNETGAGGQMQDNGVLYYYGGDSELVVGVEGESTVVAPNTTQIVHSKTNILINGDVIFDTGVGYAMLSDLPKVVIYAENDIIIDCNVKRIDAVLVAGKEVRTCAYYDDEDSRYETPDVNVADRANQLIINGAVITNKLEPSRTYGAATGANSIVPAEIINFDPTLYRWGGEDSEDAVDANTNMDATYIKELAPRF